MSLISKTNVALIADKDIICYKLVYPIYDNPIKYNSIYKHYPIEKGLNYPKGGKTINKYDGSFEIGQGFFHSYVSLYIAKLSLLNNQEIFECIIPKGSEYFISEDNLEYASDKLLVCEIF